MHIHRTGPLFLLSNIPAPVQGENLSDRALTSLSPAQSLMKAFCNSTLKMKDKEWEKRRSAYNCLRHMSVLCSLSLYQFWFFFQLSAVCVKGPKRRKKKITFVGACTMLISIFLTEASRPRVTSNCVSNWLLPMQLRLCHTRFFTVWSTGEWSSFRRTTVALQQI